MIINGKDRGFAFTVEASEEVSKLCPDGDFKNIGKLFQGSTYSEMIQLDIKIALIMNKAYEDKKAYFERDYQPQYLTEKDFAYIEVSEIQKLENELLRVIQGDSKPTIQTKDNSSKKKE